MPREVVDQIYEELWLEKTHSAYEVLSRLCLASRAALSSAQRQFYRAPFRSRHLSKSRPRLACLFRTLIACVNLRRFVRQLNGLSSAVSRFPDLSDPDAVVISIEQRSWQDALLELCSRLEQVSVYLSEPVETKHIAMILEAKEKLTSVGVAFSPTSEHGSHSLFSTWATAYKRLTSLPHSHLRIKLPECTHGGAYHATHPFYKIILILTTSYGASTSSSVLTPHCRTLPCLYDRDDYEYYQHDEEEDRTFPLAGFSHLPNLETFRLTFTSSMTLEKLSLLANSSPALSFIDLSGSIWTTPRGDFLLRSSSSPGTAPAAPVETQLTDILNRLPALKRVNFGVFPFEPGRRELPALRWYCEECGVRSKWAGVEPAEEASDW
ncbi:hypothetical protein JCM8547_006927 [Rhodosporidiobolus lusitaniae]